MSLRPTPDPTADTTIGAGLGSRLGRSPAAIVGLGITLGVVALAVLADVISVDNPFLPVGGYLRPPSLRHLLGTDQFGRDLFSEVTHGLRTSLLMVAGVTVLSGGIGTAAGVAAGYRGGLVDDVAMRSADTVACIPRFFLAVLMVTVVGTDTTTLVVLLGLTSWPGLARMVRSETLALRDRSFVEAARANGATGRHVVFRHVVPNVAPTAIVAVSLVGGRVILLEAGLAFLGFTDPDTMSLGMLIRNAEAHLRVAWWISVLPGLAIVATVLGLNLVADGINDVLVRTGGVGGRDRFDKEG